MTRYPLQMAAAALVALLSLNNLALATPSDPPQSTIRPDSPTKLNYPKIVLYSTSWCPHCKAAKEYFTKNNIPFINRDVEIDDSAMTDLTQKYKSQGVPLIVLGDDKKILKGFNSDNFEKSIRELQAGK